MILIFIYQEVSLGRTAVQTCRVRCDKKTVSNLYQTGLLWGSQLRRGPAGPQRMSVNESANEHPAPGKFSLKENHEKHKKTNNLTWLLVPHFLF